MLIDMLTLYLKPTVQKKRIRKKFISEVSEKARGNHIRLHRVVCKKPIYVRSLSLMFNYGEFTRVTMIRKKNTRARYVLQFSIRLGFSLEDEFTVFISVFTIIQER